MARQLKVYVVLRETPGAEPVSFGPKDKLPKWAADQIANSDHLFEDPEDKDSVHLPAPRDLQQDDPRLVQTGEPTVREPAATDLGQSEIEPDDDEEEKGEAPRRNHSLLAWTEYAEQNGVPVTPNMGRDDVIKACEEAGVL